jgi:hypothetical protein
MPRPKYKSYFTITITHEQIEIVPGGAIAKTSGETNDKKLEYVSQPDTKEAVTRTIYTQTLERIDLKKVIEAVNSKAISK